MVYEKDNMFDRFIKKNITTRAYSSILTTILLSRRWYPTPIFAPFFAVVVSFSAVVGVPLKILSSPTSTPETPWRGLNSKRL
jgi:hypothetical protein